MPTVMRGGPYRFFFFSGDRDEPEHIHVELDRFLAKFWLEPVRLQESGGFRGPELRRIERLVRDQQADLMEAWHEFLGT